MLGTTPAIIMEVFPRNESGGTRFSKFHCKRVPSNGEAAVHSWLAWKDRMFCYYCKSFRFWIPTITALNTSPLCRYYTLTSLLIREVPSQKGGI